MLPLPTISLVDPTCRESPNVWKLFYDLFFVANLTTFTGLHEINTSKALEAYIGYFWLVHLLADNPVIDFNSLEPSMVCLVPGDHVRCSIRYR